MARANSWFWNGLQYECTTGTNAAGRSEGRLEAKAANSAFAQPSAPLTRAKLRPVHLRHSPGPTSPPTTGHYPAARCMRSRARSDARRQGVINVPFPDRPRSAPASSPASTWNSSRNPESGATMVDKRPQHRPLVCANPALAMASNGSASNRYRPDNAAVLGICGDRHPPSPLAPQSSTAACSMAGQPPNRCRIVTTATGSPANR